MEKIPFDLISTYWIHINRNNLKRSQTFPRSATPVPPTGLNFGDFVEDFEMMDGRNSILDLANAPPLFQDQVEMDVMPSGEKRKTTPPDLLTLSNMYFERKQVVRIESNI